MNSPISTDSRTAAGRITAGRFEGVAMSKIAIASDSNLHLRPGAAELAEKLATDKHWLVRGRLAGNQSLHLLPNSAELAAKLAADDDWMVRSELVKNPIIHLLPNAADLAMHLADDGTEFI